MSGLPFPYCLATFFLKPPFTLFYPYYFDLLLRHVVSISSTSLFWKFETRLEGRIEGPGPKHDGCDTSGPPTSRSIDVDVSFSPSLFDELFFVLSANCFVYIYILRSILR